jgi:hypothetical protein
MVTPAEAKESHEVLLFIVLPLVCMVGAGFAVIIWRSPRKVAKFPNFSVKIERLGRDDSYITYREGDKRIDFNAGPCERAYVCLEAIRKHPIEDLDAAVPNLISGLVRLGFKQYTIYTEDGRIIAESEQNRKESRSRNS